MDNEFLWWNFEDIAFCDVRHIKEDYKTALYDNGGFLFSLGLFDNPKGFI